MAREYYINGQCMVSVRGMVGSGIADAAGHELGLTDGNGKVTIMPNYKHFDLKTDDFGDKIPADTLWMLADATITMTLVHFDNEVLSKCIIESAGGGTEGTMKGAGQPMSTGGQLYSAGNHFITLYLFSPDLNQEWAFAASYLSGNPIVWPISAERSLVRCTWRAIPYVPLVAGGEMLSAGALIWTVNNI